THKQARNHSFRVAGALPSMRASLQFWIAMPLFSLSRGRRALLLATLAVGAALPAGAAGPTLLNVSYDVSREFYKDFNTAFAAHWKKSTGEDITLNQS